MTGYPDVEPTWKLVIDCEGSEFGILENWPQGIAPPRAVVLYGERSYSVKG
jgi:hypothetical protein